MLCSSCIHVGIRGKGMQIMAFSERAVYPTVLQFPFYVYTDVSISSGAVEV